MEKETEEEEEKGVRGRGLRGGCIKEERGGGGGREGSEGRRRKRNGEGKFSGILSIVTIYQRR